MLQGAVLYVKDLGAMTGFYTALGGQVTVSEPGEYAMLAASGSDLILLQVPEQVAAAIEINVPPVIRSGTPIKPILLVPSIDAAQEALPALGGLSLPGATTWQFRGHLVQDIVDPEGNVIQLWQPETP